MAGRNPKPIGLQILEGNPNRKTKKEIEERKACEIKIGDAHYHAPQFIMDDPEAIKVWNQIIKYLKKYKEFANLITSTDSNLIGLYCQTFSEQLTLIQLRNSSKSNKTKIKYQIQLLKTRETLLKLSRELFLTPMSKIRSIGRVKETPKDNAPRNEFEQEFGNL
jgi:phage terminase small subunit